MNTTALEGQIWWPLTRIKMSKQSLCASDGCILTVCGDNASRGCGCLMTHQSHMTGPQRHWFYNTTLKSSSNPHMPTSNCLRMSSAKSPVTCYTCLKHPNGAQVPLPAVSLDRAELKSKDGRTDTQRANALPSLLLHWLFRPLYAHCKLANYHGVLCYPPLPPSNRAQHTPTSPAGMGRTDSNLPVTALGRAVIKPSVLLRW